MLKIIQNCSLPAGRQARGVILYNFNILYNLIATARAGIEYFINIK